MKNVLKKMKLAVESVKATAQSKDGYNSYSNYNYFTPEKVESIVNNVCKDNNLFTKFDLKRNELGIYGVLEVYDMETNEMISYEMASAIPTMTATNAAQQLGGSLTYTKRYLLMNAFGIADNSLDPDTTENTKNRVQAEKPQIEKPQVYKPQVQKPKVAVTWLTKEQFNLTMVADKVKIENVLKMYSSDTHKMRRDFRTALENKLKELNNVKN